MDTQFDTRQGYCKKLGHDITFKYCREENDLRPCAKIRDCWFKCIGIDHFLNQNYKNDELEYLTILPKPKLGSIVELILQAQKIVNK